MRAEPPDPPVEQTWGDWWVRDVRRADTDAQGNLITSAGTIYAEVVASGSRAIIVYRPNSPQDPAKHQATFTSVDLAHRILTRRGYRRLS